MSADPRLRWAVASVFLAVALGLAKLLAWRLSGSAAIFSDAAESLVNVAASSFAAYSVWLSARPADHNHPYGHGKIEYLSAGFEGGLILLAAVLILREAAAAFSAGSVPGRLGVSTLIVAGAGVANGAFGYALLRAGRRYRSASLRADGQHLLSDAASSAALVLGLGAVALTGQAWVDPFIALLFSLWVAWAGLHVLREAVAGLMNETDPALLAQLREAIDAALPPEAVDLHRLRAWQSGGRIHIDAHLTLPPDWTLRRCHAAAAELETRLREQLGDIEAIFHLDPAESAPHTTPPERVSLFSGDEPH